MTEPTPHQPATGPIERIPTEERNPANIAREVGWVVIPGVAVLGAIHIGVDRLDTLTYQSEVAYYTTMQGQEEQLQEARTTLNELYGAVFDKSNPRTLDGVSYDGKSHAPRTDPVELQNNRDFNARMIDQISNPITGVTIKSLIDTESAENAHKLLTNAQQNTAENIVLVQTDIAASKPEHFDQPVTTGLEVLMAAFMTFGFTVIRKELADRRVRKKILEGPNALQEMSKEDFHAMLGEFLDEEDKRTKKAPRK